MYLDRKSAAEGFLGRSLRVTLPSVFALLALAGCGASYRPVISAISPVGPAAQPTKYAIAVSTNPNANGLVTFVDFSGDTILDTTALGFQPYYFNLNSTTAATVGYTLNCDGTLNGFTLTTTLIQSQILQTTLLPNIPGTLPANLPCPTAPTNSIYAQGNSIYVTELGRSALAELEGLPAAIAQEIPTGPNTIYTVGSGASPRVYAIVQGANPSTPGHVAAIETTTQTISANLPVGNNPIYGVMTADSRRAFILNQGSHSISVINSQTNALDTFNTGTTTSSTIGLAGAPVWADFAPTLAEMVVASQGNNPALPGTVSIVSIPLCNAVTVTTNPNCDTSNPVDAQGFGTVIATIPVGVNPVMVAVLADGTQAYVANAGNATTPGSVSVINLNTNTVIATLPAGASTNPTDNLIHGHPNWIAATTGTPTGKVYVTAADSTDLTVIRTDIDVVTTHVALQGFGVAVRVTAP